MPPCANADGAPANGPLKRSADEGNSEPAPKRSRLQSWFGAPSRALSAISNFIAAPAAPNVTEQAKGSSSCPPGLNAQVVGAASAPSCVSLGSVKPLLNALPTGARSTGSLGAPAQQVAIGHCSRSHGQEATQLAPKTSGSTIALSSASTGRTAVAANNVSRSFADGSRYSSMDPALSVCAPDHWSRTRGERLGGAVVDATPKGRAQGRALEKPDQDVQNSRKRVGFEEEAEKPSPGKQSFSSLLRVLPGREVRFAKCNPNRPGASNSTVTLTNASQGYVAFKIKATSAGCLALPSTGTLKPGQNLEVRLTLGSACGTHAVKEKYLIQAMPVQSPVTPNREQWAKGKNSGQDVRLLAVRDAA